MGTETTVVKRFIKKSELARTQKTWAKKKPAKKAAKKPAKKAKKAKKKKKKRKKKKAKKVRFPGGKRRKGQHKSKATRSQVTKAVWVHIKKKGLNKGRNVGKIDGIFGGGSMFKLAGAISKHIK